ncbi:FAD-dependent monooxygenase [Xenorhabdus sp. TH1]|uniref:FAD-dependent oxidoreductase n=1 Tax=Xenorhabdus sp. TH1 TaxID=3130166 RepID=UPI0030D5A875
MKKILIIGAGPVGLMTGCYLNKYNICFDIIDKNTESTTYSKALTVSPATIKAFYGLNLADKLVKKGHQVNSVYAFYKNKRFLHINNKYLSSCYKFHISIPQPETEQILENHLQQSGVRVKRGCKLISWTREKGLYKATLLDENGIVYTSLYDYIIGADGATSTVRELAGINFSGHNYDMHFIMADVQFGQNKNIPVTSYYINENGFLIFLPMPDNMVRIVIKKDGKLPLLRPIPNLMEINNYISRYCNQTGEANKLVWSSSANFYNRIADENFKENIFLVGDAFHLFSPIGGQGMNTGIQDAINLAWKLAFYLKGVSNFELLNTYRSQRFTAVRKVLNSTDHDTGLIAGLIPHRSVDAVYYPEFCNRDYYRHELPHKYAGFSASLEISSGTMEGHHVPWFEFSSNKYGFKNTYDAFSSGKIVIFSARKKCSVFNIMKESEFFIFYHIEKEDTALIMHLQINNDEYAVLNPDGYLGFTGKETELIQYFSSLYNLV